MSEGSLKKQLLSDISTLQFNLSRVKAIVGQQKEEASPQEAISGFLSNHLAILEGLSTRLQSLAKSVSLADTSSLQDKILSQEIALIGNCIVSLGRSVTHTSAYAEKGNLLTGYAEKTKAYRDVFAQGEQSVDNPELSALTLEELRKLSYLLSFISHAGHLDPSKPISVQISMLEGIEVVWQPVDNHVSLMVASQDYASNTNPYSVLRMAHEVMAIMAGSQALLGQDAPTFVLAPHCKSTKGRGPMMAHILVYSMLRDKSFEEYGDFFRNHSVMMLGAKPIDVEGYRKAIEGASKYASDLLTTQVMPEGETKHITQGATGQGASDDEEVSTVTRQESVPFSDLSWVENDVSDKKRKKTNDRLTAHLVEKTPLAMGQRVSADKNIKAQVFARRQHTKKANKVKMLRYDGKNQYYSLDDFLPVDSKGENADLPPVSHETIFKTLRGKRKGVAHYKGGGPDSKKTLTQFVADVFDQAGHDTLLHRGVITDQIGDHVEDQERLYGSAQWVSSLDLYVPDAGLSLKGWFSPPRKEEELFVRHCQKAESDEWLNERVRGYKATYKGFFEEDGRCGQHATDFDQLLRALAAQHKKVQFLLEKDKFLDWYSFQKGKLDVSSLPASLEADLAVRQGEVNTDLLDQAEDSFGIYKSAKTDSQRKALAKHVRSLESAYPKSPENLELNEQAFLKKAVMMHQEQAARIAAAPLCLELLQDKELQYFRDISSALGDDAAVEAATHVMHLRQQFEKASKPSAGLVVANVLGYLGVSGFSVVAALGFANIISGAVATGSPIFIVLAAACLVLSVVASYAVKKQTAPKKLFHSVNSSVFKPATDAQRSQRGVESEAAPKQE